MAPTLLFTVVAWFSISCQGQKFDIPYKQPENCKSDEYFQFSSFGCKPCGDGQKQSGNRLSCVCKPGFKLVAHLDNENQQKGPRIQCESCSTNVLNKTASLDGSFCVECPTDVGFNTNTGECNDCPRNSFPSDREPDGAERSRRECIACTAGQTEPWGGGEGSFCRRCHSSFTRNETVGTCSCSCSDCTEIGGVCVKGRVIDDTNSRNDIYRITYNSENNIVSYYFKDNFRAVQALCRDKSNLTACQVLGNLCVLLTYNRNKQGTTDACKEYDKLIGDWKGEKVYSKYWPVVMPWLYYEEGSAVRYLDAEVIGTMFKTGQTVQFNLAEYTLNGSFFGQENGTIPIQLCQDRPSKMAAADKFATTFRSSCSVSIKSLMNRQMLFYDMYMFTGNQKIYPVPVLVDSYESNEGLINQKTDRTKWQLVRRFFLVDNVVGKTDKQDKLKYLRYAESIELLLRLRSNDGEIYPPLLKIKYNTKDVSDNLVVETGTVAVSFAVTYEMDLSRITKDVEVSILNTCKSTRFLSKNV